MIRAFAIALSIATMRLIFIPTLIVADPTDAQIAILSNASFAAAFGINGAVAEAWIRVTRVSSVPEEGMAKAI